MNTKYCKAGIKRTIKKLDAKIPKWRCLVDLDTLDIGDCYHCVTGQIFGYYDKGLQELGIADYEAEYYGLLLGNLDASIDEYAYERGYGKLTQLWKEVIANEST